MVEQTSSLWERLKACWHILTKDNYAVFCINNNHIVWNEDGTYNRIKLNSIACYCKATYDVKLKMKGAAIAAMQGILCTPIVDGIDPNPSKEHIAELAVAQANALIEELKRK